MVPLNMDTPQGMRRYLAQLRREIEYMTGCIYEHLEEACAALEPEDPPRLRRPEGTC